VPGKVFGRCLSAEWRCITHLGGAFVGAVAGSGVLCLLRRDQVQWRDGDAHGHHAAVVLTQLLGEVHADSRVVSCCNPGKTICHISSTCTAFLHAAFLICHANHTPPGANSIQFDASFWSDKEILTEKVEFTIKRTDFVSFYKIKKNPIN
jgi:hypothetical protein